MNVARVITASLDDNFSLSRLPAEWLEKSEGMNPARRQQWYAGRALLAEAMLRVLNNGVRPQFSERELEGLDKERTYQSYVNLVQELIGGQTLQVSEPLAMKLG